MKILFFLEKIQNIAHFHETSLCPLTKMPIRRALPFSLQFATLAKHKHFWSS